MVLLLSRITKSQRLLLFQVTSGYRFLNSGGFIGEARALKELLDHKELKNDDDDQVRENFQNVPKCLSYGELFFHSCSTPSCS